MAEVKFRDAPDDYVPAIRAKVYNKLILSCSSIFLILAFKTFPIGYC